MTYHEASEPACKGDNGAIALTIQSKPKDLGEMMVRRVLPSARQRMVGPFIFFDHMGPAEFPPGKGIAVRPHPHIGIATITYLFEGQIMHRDSLGFVQPIEQGAVNLMTAGRGIVHSERAGDDIDERSALHGIQSWIALPEDKEEIDPGFLHYPADALPVFDVEDARVCVIMGEAFGRRSPVLAHSPTVYLEVTLPANGSLTLPAWFDEQAVYVVSGDVSAGDRALPEGMMAVLCPGQDVSLRAREDCRLMVVGGTTIGKRHIWWNFVSSSKARIEQAKDDWKASRFDGVPGDDEFIPLPD